MPELHFVWVGGGPGPQLDVMLQWQKDNPEFQIVLWVDTKVTAAAKIKEYEQYRIQIRDVAQLPGAKVPPANGKMACFQIDKHRPNYGAASDLLRYKILQGAGGAYTDTDASAVPSVEDTKPANNVGNDLFIATQVHPLMNSVMKAALEKAS